MPFITRLSFRFQSHFTYHGDVNPWKRFPRYWPLVMGIHQSPVDSHHKGPVLHTGLNIFFHVSLNKRFKNSRMHVIWDATMAIVTSVIWCWITRIALHRGIRTINLLVSWWRHQMGTFSALLAICAGNSPVPGEFPTQRPVTRSFDFNFDLCPNKRLSKQSWGWWFETLSHPLWRHCNGSIACMVADGIINHDIDCVG